MSDDLQKLIFFCFVFFSTQNDNNNNNLFNSNNVNMARLFGEKRFRGTTESDCEDEVIFALRNKSLSPWSWKFFELVRLKAGKVGGGAAVMMHKWLSLVATAFPGCLLNLTCHSLSIRSVL